MKCVYLETMHRELTQANKLDYLKRQQFILILQTCKMHEKENNLNSHMSFSWSFAEYNVRNYKSI